MHLIELGLALWAEINTLTAFFQVLTPEEARSFNKYRCYLLA